MITGKILIIEDEKDVCRYIQRHLMIEENLEVEIQFAHDRDTAMEAVERGSFDLIISDLWIPDLSGILDKEGGMKVVERAMELPHPPEVIIITGHGSPRTALEAIGRIGACDYIVKPIDYAYLVDLVKQTLEKRKSAAAEGKRDEAEFKDYEIIGSTPQMIEVMKAIGRFARSDDTVLIQGESGTGKELAARAIHEHSARKDGPFIPVNVNAIVPELMEAELFGIGKRVATGVDARPGLFMQARGGTLFLDEIGELSLDIQPKLLRAIDFKEIQRVGGSTVRVDVRIIAATNKNLREAVERGEFRKDLFFRLSGATIHIPPLRERKADIPILANYFLRKHSSILGKDYIHGFSEEVIELLEGYSWPGNVRELENAVKYAISTCKGGTILPADLPPDLLREMGRSEASQKGKSPLDEILTIDDLKEAQRRFERVFILKKLRENSWNISLTAKKLGITRQQLHKKINKLNLRDEDQV
jgi:DNA-binding NtrC family response regulator